jgi:hypothetical protein
VKQSISRSIATPGIDPFRDVYRRYLLFDPKRMGVFSGARSWIRGNKPNSDRETGHVAERALDVHSNVRRSHPVYTAEIEIREVYTDPIPIILFTLFEKN